MKSIEKLIPLSSMLLVLFFMSGTNVMAASITFDFESGMSGSTFDDFWGTAGTSVLQTKGSETLIVTVSEGVLYCNESDRFGFDAFNNVTGNFCTGDQDEYLSSITLSLQSGNTFNLDSLLIGDYTGFTSFNITYTTSKGTVAGYIPAYIDESTATLTNLSSEANLQGITSVTITSDSDPLTVVLEDVSITTVESAPTTQASAVGFSSTSTSGTTIGWTRGNGANCAVFMAEASSGTASPVDANTYTANTTFGSGTQIGSTGWYCVYNGTGTSVSVSGLSLANTYRAHVCEYNGSAGSELYLVSPGTDNPDNVTTSNATIIFVNGANVGLNFVQSNAVPPVSDWLCGQFSLAGDVMGATLNSVTLTLGGTYDPGDLSSTPFQLYASNTNNFGSSSAIGSSVADPGSGYDVTFSGLSDAIPASARYYWVTADISASATGDDTINGSIDAAGDLSITSGTLSGSSSYGKLNAGADASLPVDLSSFSAVCQGQSIILEWVTESETDNLGFIIERKTENSEWTTVAAYQTNDDLKGQGNTSSKTEYTFTDTDVEPETSYEYCLSDVSTDGKVTVYASLSITLNALPEETGMEKAYPNPFNLSTFISYHLAEDSQVEISVYDMLGRKVQTLFTGQQLAGSYNVYWHGKSDKGTIAPTGTYLIRMQAGDMQEIQKVMLIK